MTRRYTPGAFGASHRRPPAATVSVAPVPCQDTMRTVTVDCAHGTTTLTIAEHPSGVQIAGQAAAVIAVQRHFAEEGCACTAELRRRYGVAP